MTGRLKKPSATMDGRRVAMDPRILDAYVENQPWNALAGGSVGRTRAQEVLRGSQPLHATYAPMDGWDGLGVDPAPFSRLDTKHGLGATGLQLSQGCAGAAAFYVGPAKEGGALCHQQPPTHAESTVPFTLEQQLSQRLPGRGEALAQGAPTFRNMFAHAEEVVRTTTPAAYRATMAAAEKGALITPAQRRAALNFQKETERARATVKRGELQERRLHHLMRQRHPQGAMNVDSTRNPDSITYGETAREILKLDRRHASHASRRRKNLQKLLCGETTHGYDPFAHTTEARKDRFLQAKTFGAGRPTHSTHDRLFTHKEYEPKPARAQFLRDRHLEGKQYDVVGGFEIEFLPSQVPERANKALAHPSQCTTQGSLGRPMCLL